MTIQPSSFSSELSVDVALAYRGVGPVLRTVVSDSDLHFVIGHVKARDKLSVLVEYAKLCLRGRQARVDQGQPSDGLLGRLGPAVY